MNPDLRGNQASMKLELMPFVAVLKYATESEHLKLFYCFFFFCRPFLCVTLTNDNELHIRTEHLTPASR